MNRPLFRDEALQAQQGPWLGRVILLRPLSLQLVTGAVMAVVLAVLVFLWLAHYTRKASVDGVLVPHGAVLQAQLLASGGAVGFVHPGQAVRLRLEGFPHQKFGHLEGRVVQVSRTPLPAGEAPAAPMPGGQALFRITVALDDAAARAWPQPLEPGMRLQADVLLERRRLIEWLFEPLSGLQRRL